MAKKVVLNLKEMRAARAEDAPAIVDFDGNAHVILGLTMDAYLNILEIQDRFGALQGDQDKREQAKLLEDVKAIIQATVPTFPAGGLYLEEAFLVVQAVQGAVGDAVPTSAPSEEAGKTAEEAAAPGESTSPA